MAKYQWDLYEIRNNINLLQARFNESNDENQRMDIQDTIDQYQEMLTVVHKKKTHFLETETISSLEQYIKQYMGYLKEENVPLINIILDTYPLVKDFKRSNDINYIVTFSNERLLEICFDFLKTSVPSPVWKKNEQAILNHRSHLHIHYSLDNNNGVTYIDPILQKKYILFNRHNDEKDFCVLPHEYFHFIFNDYQSDLDSNNPMYYSQELEGSFVNLLFIEYFKKQYPNISKKLEEVFLCYYQMKTISMVILADYMQSITDKGKFHKNKFDQYLNYFGFNKPLSFQDIKEYIDEETADDNITYNLSYLAAIDLFYIYQQDPEFAFYLLQNIRSIKSHPNVLNVFRQNHITFMDDNFNNFKKYIKKIER